MTHQICDACECVSHCRKNGCVPLTPMDQAPVVTSSTDPKYLREALDKTFELLVRERGIVKDLVALLRNLDARLMQAAMIGADVREAYDSYFREEVREALAKVPQ